MLWEKREEEGQAGAGLSLCRSGKKPGGNVKEFGIETEVSL